MALASIAVPADPKRDARARALVSKVKTWHVFTLKQPFGSFEAGSKFRQAKGSHGERYLVNAVACQCPDYAQMGHICKHIRAVVLWEAKQAKPAPKPLSRYAQLYPKCHTCPDLADTRDGYCDKCASEREWQARRAS
jgi:hypothetical protein